MGRLITQRWQDNAGALRARDRRAGTFNRYVPHPLSAWHPLEGDLVPPPPDYCFPLLDDLVGYVRSDDPQPASAISNSSCSVREHPSVW